MLSSASLVSCSNNSYSWSGYYDTYKRDYTKYDQTSISQDEMLSKYFSNNQLEIMFCQDIIYNLNFKCKLYDSSILFTYEFSHFSHSQNRLSYRVKVFDENQQLLIYIDVRNLQYCFICYDSIEEGTQPLLSVTHTRYENGQYFIDPNFWDDIKFHIILQSYNDGKIDIDYDFCWKEFDELARQNFQDIYVDWFVFTPYYYEGVEVKA